MSVLSVAEQIALAVCWLYRWQGDFRLASVSGATAERHGPSCDWCDYPVDQLLRLGLQREDFDSPRVRDFNRLPQSEQRRLVDIALHGGLL